MTKTNAGYDILLKKKVDKHRFVVLGCKSACDWVTWMYRNDRKDYYWGHYTMSREKAMADYAQRIRDYDPHALPPL